jgi:4-aminobutyrate aminotransferase-like enzyme
MRRSVNHNDANDYNILIGESAENTSDAGLIDFGDAVYTHTINELAILLAYVVMKKENPLQAALPVIKGYHSKFPLMENELAVLFSMIATRLLISVTCSALNRLEWPDNSYLQVSEIPSWDLLKKLKTISPAFAHYSFRSACGLEPCIHNHRFQTWTRSNHRHMCYPIDGVEQAPIIDLSVGSTDLGTMNDLLDPELLSRNVSRTLEDRAVAVLIGRYDEARAFYTTDAFVTPENDGAAWRTVHIGLDYFVSPGTEVKAVYDGSVFNVKNNIGDRDYGPTVILEHRVTSDLCFYSLYGHLSVDSLPSLDIGRPIKKGEVVGRIGSRSENGNWPPHLHFQVMLDMLGKNGDFPGVASVAERSTWKSICPDPALLFAGKVSAHGSTMSGDDLVTFRKQHLGKNMSISYADPIEMVRGHGVFMFDKDGRRYLDTVNNVAHVGHEHPRIVAAGQRQMAVLNTNTRYLHKNIVRFVETLLKTLPDKFQVAYIVNSGSEANELGLRLAKTFTGQRDMIVSEVGYHGNTNACVAISAYKFNGHGGNGPTPDVHVVPIPDTYRGLYRSNDPEAGIKYASHVNDAVQRMEQEGRKPAALILESVISCGGQVELPTGYLHDAYRFVRNAGGVCIADEVQTGCGRAGDSFWTFEQHGVIPDIVTIGKPIGNGHPLAAVVTTHAIAEAFDNGMEYFNTFGGNPVSCAIGLEVLRVIADEGLQENARDVGAYLKSGLLSLMRQHAIVGDVRGPGLFIGIELVKNRDTLEPATREAAYVVNRMRQKGILMSTDGPYNNVLKVKPPIVFTRSNADALLDALSSVLREDFMNRDRHG